MNKYIILLWLFSLSFSTKAQQQNTYEFQPLTIIDTINQNIVDKIKLKDKVKNTQYFFAQTYDNKKGLFLFKKTKKNWIVYDYDVNFKSNYSITKHIYYSKRFVAIDIGAMRSGMGENWYNWLIIFDLIKSSYVILDTFSHNSGEYSNKKEFKHECGSKIQYMKNGNFKVVKKCNVEKEENKNYCNNCLDSGIYIIENGNFKKIKSSH